MPFHVQKRRALSVFHRLTGKFGKELFEVKPEKTFTENDLFFHFLQTSMPINEFESLDTINRVVMMKKGSFLAISDLINQNKKWNGFSFSPIVYKYLYNKTRLVLPELSHLSKKEHQPLSLVIESFNPKHQFNQGKKIWKLNPKTTLDKYIEEIKKNASIQTNSCTNKEKQMTNIIVNVPKNSNNTYSNELKNRTQLIFQGKMCRLFINNKTNYSLNEQKPYDICPEPHSKTFLYTPQKKKKSKKKIIKKIDTNCYLPTIKKCISGFKSPITSKHRKTFSTQITQSTSMNTTKNKDIKKIKFFHISKQKPLKVLFAPNTKIFLSDF